MNTFARKLASALATISCSLLPLGSAWAAPTLSYTSQSSGPGLLTFGIAASGFTDLYAYQVDLVFDPTLLQAVAVTEGPFLRTAGTTFFDGGVVDNLHGIVSFTFDTLLGPGPGVTGSGILESIQLSVTKAGSAAFSFANLLALDSNLNTITVTPLGTTFVVPIPEPDTLSLMLLTFGGLAALVRRKRAAATSLPAPSR